MAYIDEGNIPQQDDPVVDAPIETISEAKTTNGGAVPGADIIGQQSSYGLTITEPLNANAMRLDLLATYVPGAYCVLRGLVLSVPGGGGLDLPITAGHAFIGTITEIAANTEIAVPDETAIVYIWLMQNGTLVALSSDTPPDGAACFIGHCTTTGGDITEVGFTGVMYWRGGLIRETGVSGPPTDTPSSVSRMLTRTETGLYLWDGEAHLPVGQQAKHIAGQWRQTNASASQTAVALTRSDGTVLALRHGFLTGLAVKSNEARTAGTLTVEVYIGGVASGLSAILNATDTTFAVETSPEGLIPISAGDELDIRVTTSGTWAPTTADIVATLELM